MIEPSLAGTEVAAVSFRLERGKLAELARALHDPDPVWWSDGAAIAAGFAGIPLPPTATVLSDQWREAGALALADAIGADRTRLLHGEASWEIVGTIAPNEQLDARTTVTDISQREGRRGGQMTIALLETRFCNAAGELVVVRRDTLIETGS